MAGDWIKMRVNLDADPSVIMMAAAFGTDELCIVGRLWKVWAWADQQSIDGNAVRVTCSFIDRITNCPGFAKAMQKAGWLEGRDGALTFPHFDRHNGQPSKQRALTAKRVKEHRNAKSVTSPLPEKRREEDNPPTPQGGGGMERVAEEIYRLYPRKTKDRTKALAAIIGALAKVDPDTLRAAVIRYSRKPGLDRENGRFIPSAISWFSDDCWRDHLPPPGPMLPVANPQPSQALIDLRLVFDRGAQLNSEEEFIALGAAGKLTDQDKTLLTTREQERIAALHRTTISHREEVNTP